MHTSADPQLMLHCMHFGVEGLAVCRSGENVEKSDSCIDSLRCCKGVKHLREWQLTRDTSAAPLAPALAAAELRTIHYHVKDPCRNFIDHTINPQFRSQAHAPGSTYMASTSAVLTLEAKALSGQALGNARSAQILNTLNPKPTSVIPNLLASEWTMRTKPVESCTCVF